VTAAMSASASSRYSGQFTPGTPVQSSRLRNTYQQSPPPNSNQNGGGGGGGGGARNKDRNVSMIPNDIKIPKPPKQPDKPLPAYMRYSRKVWESVKATNPEMKMWDIGKLIGEQWRNLPEDERQGFNAEYEVEKLEYQDAMKNYHNSTAYREWLKQKEKAQSAIQEQQMQEKLMGGTMPKEEPRFQLQQIEDDDEEAEFSVKHVAAARFQRNHRLIVEILGDTVVPDVKTIVTRPRHENLKRQVQSLMQHQRKLESEIQVMEDNFSATKKLILDRSTKFQDSITKYLGPLPDVKSDDEKSTGGSGRVSPEIAETPLCETAEDMGSPVLPQVRELVTTDEIEPRSPKPTQNGTEDNESTDATVPEEKGDTTTASTGEGEAKEESMDTESTDPPPPPTSNTA